MVCTERHYNYLYPMKALTFSSFGSPEVLEYTDVPSPVLQPGELLVQMKAIGLNYADVYRRRGNYHLKGNPPYIAGYEGAGIVIDANGVSNFKKGDSICFADVPFANSELVAVSENHAIPLPGSISFETAAAVMLQGLTAQYLSNDSYAVKAGNTVLVHACAGGVGQLLVQLCKMKGATVIGLTSSAEKAAVAKKNGADEVFLYSADWVTDIKNNTPKGVDVVYESVGTTLLQSFEAVKETGTVVFYGFAGGNPPQIDPRLLMDGSKTLVGGDLWSYLTNGEERIKRSNELFGWITAGSIQMPAPTVFSLKEGRAAHELLESRKSTGKIVLIP
jgi:NADPH:quinone reductase